ncbi:MAG: hypothetical protein V1870_01610 [Candidatus Aenigmatarchaeota archaeon]
MAEKDLINNEVKELSKIIAEMIFENLPDKKILMDERNVEYITGNMSMWKWEE